MKKIVTALVLLAMVLSIFSMTAFAVDQNTLTKAQYEELKEAADFVEEFNHGIRINFMCDMLIYLESKESQYITDKYDDGYARAAEIPANLMKDIFYEATSAPIGFFESDVLPLLNKNDEGFYNADKGTYRIFDPARGGGYYSVLNGYIDNSDSTYSFYYAGYSDYGEYEAGETPEVIVITLKLENDGITLVSDKKVDKLPTKYSEVPTATTSNETKVVYDTEKGITFADNNNFQAGTTVTAKEVKSGTAFDTAKKALAGVSSKFVVFDFSAVKSGATVQPNGKVKVTMSIPETLSADGLKMFYVSDKGKSEEIKITVDKKNKTITAELEHFSTYVLANVSTTSPKTGDNANTVILAILCLISFIEISSFAIYKTSKENG